MPQWMRLSVIPALLVAVMPIVAQAEDFVWPQVYKCALFASSLSEYQKDQGQDSGIYDKDFDALVAAAMRLHHTQYSRQHPKATGEDWQRDFDTDTSRVDDAFLREMDATPAAMDFLRSGYDRCEPMRAFAAKGPAPAK